jgi:predicted aconitase
MELTRDEVAMLEGKHGYPVQKSMELLVALGEIYGAKKMVRVSHSHFGHPLKSETIKAAVSYLEDLASRGGKFVVTTTTQALGVDPLLWKEIGISDELHNDGEAFRQSCAKMGALMCNTCTPYQVGHVPRLGEHIAWMESSAVIFSNSVLGARTNREGGPTAIAAALTGRVPMYGYHLDENRYGAFKVIVTAKINDPSDYGSLGYFIGEAAGDLTPVLVNIPLTVSWDQLKSLGAAAAASGSVALYHAVGVTPEAKFEEQAFGPGKPRDSNIIEFSTKELLQVRERLSKAKSDKIDWVIFGCPHASINEIKEIAGLLSGQTVRSSVDLRVYTSVPLKTYADRSGFTQVIEKAGGKIICESCPVSEPKKNLRSTRCKVAATNSAKLAHYIPGDWDVTTWFGSAKRCVDAAISGVWR